MKLLFFISSQNQHRLDNSYFFIINNDSSGVQEQFKALYDENEAVGTESGLHLIRDLAKASFQSCIRFERKFRNDIYIRF
jgi:hypothetical protein